MYEIPSTKPFVKQVERPWGSFAQYIHNGQGTVSLMTALPKARLSLQAHTKRAELWVVLDPGALVEIGDEVFYPNPGDEFWIPANTKHRLSSLGNTVRVLEVAFGDWQQEDITRYEDDFNRPSAGE
jgi:mannose-1-phosphate guanylyltransferase/mannose-6-phosphate isomerase